MIVLGFGCEAALMDTICKTNKFMQYIIRQILPGLIIVVAILAAQNVSAEPNRNSNCALCHTASHGAMAMSNYQSTTNLGSGLRKVFQVNPGQNVGIRLNVTNVYGGPYGVTMNNLSGAGLSNSANHLTFTADPAWVNQGGYFTVGPVDNAQPWTFNLAVAAGTPADFYSVQTQIAGKDSGGQRWSQQETFYVQVMASQPAVPPTPTITPAGHAGTSNSITVPTTNGFTYFLEFKSAIPGGSWSTLTQVAGDGTTKTLTDTNATDPHRFYRVRVQ